MCSVYKLRYPLLSYSFEVVRGYVSCKCSLSISSGKRSETLPSSTFKTTADKLPHTLDAPDEREVIGRIEWLLVPSMSYRVIFYSNSDNKCRLHFMDVVPFPIHMDQLYTLTAMWTTLLTVETFRCMRAIISSPILLSTNPNLLDATSLPTRQCSQCVSVFSFCLQFVYSWILLIVVISRGSGTVKL